MNCRALQFNYRVHKFNKGALLFHSRALQFNQRALYMCTISERTNSFEVLCYWIRELSYSIQGRIQNLHCRGAQVTNEAEGFTEARSAERGGGHPLPQVGVRGPPPEIFWEIASKWCILSAFWGNQYTFFAPKIYMKRMRLTKFT